MDDLIEFLRAQLDDDERVAREGQADGISQWLHAGSGHVMNADSWRIADATAEDNEVQVAEHIARWDPARVRAEVDAKRRILDLHSAPDICDPNGFRVRPLHCETVALLALPYADREGYRDGWRP